MTQKDYFKMIDKASTNEELDRVIIDASMDDGLTHSEYCEVFYHAIDVLKSWFE